MEFGLLLFQIVLGLAILALVWWKVFEKAGKPGWASIVPIYNLIILLEVAERPIWWLLLLLCTGPIGAILVGIAIAEKFGQGVGFGVGLGLLGIIFYPMLGFGDYRYQGGRPSAHHRRDDDY